MAIDVEQQKAVAAQAAATLVEEGQFVGLGTGTTVAFLLQALGDRVQAGLHFTGVPTSERTGASAQKLGIPLRDLDDHAVLDLDIDGADEVDPRLNLIKGRGGALLREKIVATAARRMIVVVDEGKLVEHLGDHMTVPVEVVPFGWAVTRDDLRDLGAIAEVRGGDTPFRTDNGNLIVDCRFSDLSRPVELAARIKSLPGVVEHGLFLDIASLVFVGHADGSVTRMER